MVAVEILIGVVLTVAVGFIVFRIVRGPTILDRMVASDVLLTTVMIVLAAEMVVNRHTDTLPVLLVLAATASYGTIAVARSVSKHDATPDDAVDPDAPAPDSPGPGIPADAVGAAASSSVPTDRQSGSEPGA